jgi:hypothetical protein
MPSTSPFLFLKKTLFHSLILYQYVKNEAASVISKQRNDFISIEAGQIFGDGSLGS